MNMRKLVAGLGMAILLSLTGCSTAESEKAAEEAAESATQNVEKDFKELGEETTKSLQEDSKTNEGQLTNPNDLLEVEEDMASSTR